MIRIIVKMMKNNLLLMLDEKVKKSKIYFQAWPLLSVFTVIFPLPLVHLVHFHPLVILKPS